jgi:hypothetical protein
MTDTYHQDLVDAAVAAQGRVVLPIMDEELSRMDELSRMESEAAALLERLKKRAREASAP